MRPAIHRRLIELEDAHKASSRPQSFVVMPWDLMPDAAPDALVVKYRLLRPGAVPGGEVMPFERTGIHPTQDDPNSFNSRLYREPSTAI